MIDKPIVAAFDFDGTITTKDSLLPFLFFSGSTSGTCKKLATLSPVFLRYVLGLSSRQETKEHVLHTFFANTPKDKILALGKRFAASPNLQSIVRPEAEKRIRWHQEQGHRCILVSASIDIYLDPWANMHGFQDVLTSRLKFTKEGCVEGHLEGLNCRGAEKVRRLNELLGPRDGYILYAYGDSDGDKELLEAADHAFYRHMPR